jgi:hypothetical protein
MMIFNQLSNQLQQYKLKTIKNIQHKVYLNNLIGEIETFILI